PRPPRRAPATGAGTRRNRSAGHGPGAPCSRGSAHRRIRRVFSRGSPVAGAIMRRRVFGRADNVLPVRRCTQATAASPAAEGFVPTPAWATVAPPLFAVRIDERCKHPARRLVFLPPPCGAPGPAVPAPAVAGGSGPPSAGAPPGRVAGRGRSARRPAVLPAVRRRADSLPGYPHPRPGARRGATAGHGAAPVAGAGPAHRAEQPADPAGRLAVHPARPVADGALGLRRLPAGAAGLQPARRAERQHGADPRPVLAPVHGADGGHGAAVEPERL